MESLILNGNTFWAKDLINKILVIEAEVEVVARE
jgi:hypothetical protein